MDFRVLALVMAAGLVGPLLSSVHRLAPPVVVGEIAAGIALGHSGLGWVNPNEPFLNGLATLGFALLMFIVGTHLPVRDAKLRTALTVGIGVTATTGVLAAATGVALARVVGLDRPALLAVLLATSSGAAALPIIDELGRHDHVGLTATVWIGFADVMTVLALPLVLATGQLGRVMLGGVLVIGSAAALYFAARQMRGRAVVGRLRALSRERGWGLDLRASLLALVVCGWIATRFGASVLIAGFAIGVVVALLGEPTRVAQQLVGLGEGFAIPVFFVHLGLELDVRALVHSPKAVLLAASLAAAAVAVHLVAAALWKLPIGFGLLASAQLGVPAAVVSIGLATRQLDAAQGAAVMAAAVATLGACAVGATLLGHRGHINDASAPHPKGV